MGGSGPPTEGLGGVWAASVTIAPRLIAARFMSQFLLLRQVGWWEIWSVKNFTVAPMVASLPTV
jgi:hypothetical protein